MIRSKRLSFGHWRRCPRLGRTGARVQWAEVSGLSQNSVSRIWRAFGLQPHRTETSKLSTDPLFVEKLRDIVGFHMNPPEHALVLCVDEKTQAQALDRTQPLLPMRPAQPERRTHDYKRHATTSLFAALDVATGKVIGQCHRQHRSREFRAFLNRVDAAIPADQQDVHLILDNSSTHRTPLIRSWLAAHPRYHVHFTPTSASGLILVERFFAEITEKQIRRGVFRSTRELEDAIASNLRHQNENPKPFTWTKSADATLASIGRSGNELLTQDTSRPHIRGGEPSSRMRNSESKASSTHTWG